MPNQNWKEVNWTEILIVVACGAIGGLIAWLIAAANSGLGIRWGFELAIALLAGAAAAGGGVYLLANTDTKNVPRCIFFALFCGVCWQPIFESVKSMVKGATVNKELAKAKGEVDKAIAAVGNGGTQADINKIVEGAGKLGDTLPSVSDPELRKDALQTVNKAFTQIEKFSETKPVEASIALETIGKRASASGSTVVRLTARDSLMNLKKNTRNSEAWIHAEKAIEALK